MENAEAGFSDEILGKKSLATPFRKPGSLNPPSSPNCPTNLKIVNFKLKVIYQ
jgi:hypothetical protein